MKIIFIFFVVLNFIPIFNFQITTDKIDDLNQYHSIIETNPYSIDIPVLDLKSFQIFKKIQKKSYQSYSEQTYRMLIYQQNLKKVNQHNEILFIRQATNFQNFHLNDLINSPQIQKKQFLTKTKQWSMKLNKFADLNQLEFRQIYTKTYPTSDAVKLKVQKILNQYKASIINFNGNRNTDGYIPPNPNCGRKSQTQNPNSIQTDSTKLPQNDGLDEQIRKQVQYAQNLKIQEYNKLIEKGLISANNMLQNIHSKLNSQNSNQIIQTIPRNLQQSASLNLTSSNQNTTNQTFDIDWTKNSGAVKFQGSCGACYAFASADTISAMNSIWKYGFFIPISIQQIVDCTSNGLAFGCNGGFIEGAYAQIQTKGLTTDFAYKYIGKQSPCKTTTGTYRISSFKNIDPNCPSVIQQLKKKPLAIGIAGYRLQFYSSGIFDDCNTYIDHAVVLIGYKTNIGWKIKNSWGVDWGMKGYAWIKDGNNCGICQNAITASIPEESLTGRHQQ